MAKFPHVSALPFERDVELCAALSHCHLDPLTKQIHPAETALPDRIDIKLNDTSQIHDLIVTEFWAEQLEASASHLWVMSTQSSANINTLHAQRVKGREIVVSEDPRMHLLWIRDRIFIKPLPRFLLSRVFWDLFLADGGILLQQQEQCGGEASTMIHARAAVLGYLRTYTYLIRYPSDFYIAQQDHLRLVLADVKWEDLSRFLAHVRLVIDDGNVSERYKYGELRLSRLNFYAPFLFRQAHYVRVYGHYSDYLESLYGPLLSLFALVSVILNCMQVFMVVEQVSSQHWVTLWSISRWFSTVGLVLTVFVALLFILLWLGLTVDEWIFALRVRHRRRRKSNS